MTLEGRFSGFKIYLSPTGGGVWTSGDEEKADANFKDKFKKERKDHPERFSSPQVTEFSPPPPEEQEGKVPEVKKASKSTGLAPLPDITPDWQKRKDVGD